jgi:hypothetical protein
MALTLGLEQWLKQAGYEHHAFVSWAHTINPEMGHCARRIQASIAQELALAIPQPSVFLDETHIPPGTTWAPHLQQAICRSVVMVAICAPIYYHPTHNWCGLEWAAMKDLASRRAGALASRAIVPLIFRHSAPLPNAVAAVQHIDLSRASLPNHRYYSSTAFNTVVRNIVAAIDITANAIATAGVTANCAQYAFPTESAFADYHAAQPAFPFRTSHAAESPHG